MEISQSEFRLLSEAIQLVSEFDGKNITLRKFLEQCEAALLFLPEELEDSLVKLLRNKVIKEAKKLIDEIDFNDFDDFLSYMETTFGPPPPLQQLENKLNQMHQEINEKVYYFANRVFQSKDKIINSYRANSEIFNEHKNLIDLILLEAFLNGLESEIYKQMKQVENIDDAIDEAITIERKLYFEKILKNKVENRKNQNLLNTNFEQEKETLHLNQTENFVQNKIKLAKENVKKTSAIRIRYRRSNFKRRK